MRVLHIIHQYFPEHVGGTEHYLRALAEAQRRNGHEVTIFCRRSGEGQHLDREIADDIPIYRATSGPFTPAGRFRSTLGDGFLAGSLNQVAGEVQPDLVHIQHLMGLPASAVTSFDPALPLVVTLHDYWWVCANAQLITDYDRQVCEGPRWWMNCARCGLARAGMGANRLFSPVVVPVFWWRARLLQRAMPRVAAWIAPTDFVASWHAAHGFPAERMHVVGHGIELPPPGNEVRASEAKARAAFHVAYVGGLSPQKGVHVLVDAFNRLPQQARLTIAGDEAAFPDYSGDLRLQATHPGIQFAGRLGRDEVWQVLTSADVLVVPSLWYETASLVVQEAFAVRTPVIAADHGALAERVRDEVDGLLVPRGDSKALHGALRRTMDEPNLLPRLREGIRPQRGMAEHARLVEAVYRQAVEGDVHTPSTCAGGGRDQILRRPHHAAGMGPAEGTTNGPDGEL